MEDSNGKAGKQVKLSLLLESRLVSCSKGEEMLKMFKSERMRRR